MWINKVIPVDNVNNPVENCKYACGSVENFVDIE